MKHAHQQSSGALCVDFGTSSIRAVRRLPSGGLKPLDIGRVTKSRLDDASIRSEIHVDEEQRYVRYGERAVAEYRASRRAALYEASPKLWLREPQRLAEPAARNLPLSREDLLAGLLAHAVRAAAEADGIGTGTLNRLDLRIAHPVWPADVQNAANEALARLRDKARRITMNRDWGTVPVSTLRVQAKDAPRAGVAAIDVIEPIAAAVELLPEEENLVRACAVVDVGAGTTDIGLFLSVEPDSRARVRSKLYPVGEPVSVFKAGNEVDSILLELLEEGARRPRAIDLADVRARIRGIKESLFQNGRVQELGASVRLEDVKSHPRARAMAREIRTAVESLLRESAPQLLPFVNRPFHGIGRLDVVMAGGGAGIDFLLETIRKPVEIGTKLLPVEITTPAERAGINTFGASRARMAVALGGASLHYDALQHRRPQLTRLRGGSI